MSSPFRDGREAASRGIDGDAVSQPAVLEDGFDPVAEVADGGLPKQLLEQIVRVRSRHDRHEYPALDPAAHAFLDASVDKAEAVSLSRPSREACGRRLASEDQLDDGISGALWIDERELTEFLIHWACPFSF